MGRLKTSTDRAMRASIITLLSPPSCGPSRPPSTVSKIAKTSKSGARRYRGDSMTPSPELGRAGGGSERPLEDMIARVPSELVAAESSCADRFEKLEHDFWTDPCHFLRRACQRADYGSDEPRA